MKLKQTNIISTKTTVSIIPVVFTTMTDEQQQYDDSKHYYQTDYRIAQYIGLFFCGRSHLLFFITIPFLSSDAAASRI